MAYCFCVNIFVQNFKFSKLSFKIIVLSKICFPLDEVCLNEKTNSFNGLASTFRCLIQDDNYYWKHKIRVTTKWGTAFQYQENSLIYKIPVNDLNIPFESFKIRY